LGFATEGVLTAVCLETGRTGGLAPKAADENAPTREAIKKRRIDIRMLLDRKPMFGGRETRFAGGREGRPG
jgi:hypothetical protein